MAKEIYFFTTKNDLLNIIRNVERTMRLQYVEAKACDAKEVTRYKSFEEYEGLGINKSGDHQSERFIILDREDQLILREVQQAKGGTKYFIDQMENENSVFLRPGGIYEEGYLVCGHVATISTSPSSIKLFNVFQKYIKKQCKHKSGR